MSPRSLRQSYVNDLAVPIRVKLRVPPTGLGNILTDMLLWLNSQLGPGEYAQHSVQTMGGDAVAIHLRRIADAARFLEALPMLELADGTTSRAYRSPLFPHGLDG